MLKLACILALCAVCFAQDQPPKISETFGAEVEEMLKEGRDHRRMFKGNWYRDEKAQMAVEESMFNSSTFKHLERYDMKKEFYYEKNSSGEFCKEEDMRDPKFPEVWGWIEKAHEKKVKNPRTDMEEDVWYLEFPGTELDLFTADNNKDIPDGLLEKHHRRDEERFVRFMTFDSKEPDAKMFDIPDACKK